ncbi:MAG TPA: polysaccharide deacetylase family protein [Candidatus Nitrosopolaris sp.]|nr:polysaccharide deacetylase family protein [Candidatus Nitrosopolaris sp.]
MTNISRLSHRRIQLFIIAAFLVSCIFLPPVFSNAQTGSVIGSHSNKVVILTFGDTLKSQFTNAKPILDQYGLKGNFFVTCLWVGSHIYGMSRLTWQDISALQKDGQNIGSKTMTHRGMAHLSPSDLNYEIAGSKKCLADHGINATAFATTHGNERNNATIINEISKYYDLAVNGFGNLMFLDCNVNKEYIKYSSQTDCRTYFSNGTLTFVNRYSLREWSHNNIDNANSHNDSQIFDIFVNEVNSQEKYNKLNEPILTVPIIGYHSIDNNKTSDSTDVSLFAQEMKYLHDNGFRVLTLNDLGYDTKNNLLYIKPSVTGSNQSRN